MSTIVKKTNVARYNLQVRPRNFQIYDLVLRRANVGRKNSEDGKFVTKWEGPHMVKTSMNIEAYTMETLSGKPILTTLNATKLIGCFS